MPLKKLLDELENYENPFQKQGTDDPFQNQEQKPIVNVGLVNRVEREIFDDYVGVNPQVSHILVIATYGGGKSATLRNIFNRANLDKKATAYVKLEDDKFKQSLKNKQNPAVNYCNTLLTEISEQLFKKDAKFKGKSGSEHSAYVKSRLIKFNKDYCGRPIASIFKELAKEIDARPGVVLIDEIEALLANEDVPLEVKLGILDILKNWSETTKHGLSLILAGTQPCLDFIRSRVPKLLGGRFIICDDYNLECDEVEEYILEKCRAATGMDVDSDKIFTKDACQLIFHASSGIPRRIEIIAYGAWQIAVFRKHQADRNIVRERLYTLGEGVVTHILAQYKLTELEKKALRALLRNGMNTLDAKKYLTTSEKGAIRRVAKRHYNSPIITKRCYGRYEFSDQLLVQIFSKNQG